jgi:hypothetical protein
VTGVQTCALPIFHAGQYDAELDKLARELDAKNEQGILERAVGAKLRAVNDEAGIKAIVAEIAEVEKLGIKDAELKEELYFAAAVISFQYLDDKPGAKSWAEKLKAIAPDKPEYAEVYDMILG